MTFGLFVKQGYFNILTAGVLTGLGLSEISEGKYKFIWIHILGIIINLIAAKVF